MVIKKEHFPCIKSHSFFCAHFHAFYRCMASQASLHPTPSLPSLHHYDCYTCCWVLHLLVLRTLQNFVILEASLWSELSFRRSVSLFPEVTLPCSYRFTLSLRNITYNRKWLVVFFVNHLDLWMSYGTKWSVHVLISM